ncbi:solute carrier family 41 member 1-like isoform X2 [Paramacrobiotus metropolitanus]|uniref:solute carrier family 41 member 1-like isoform X2 n=1 Tax=Paramacrobiotus metropolitanus TaxID=2943436 RepID=UPI002445EF1D|nr:solute carrier family 41 member 1-like isoform X2 [Paramacrobiotus metropolitanus]XP_055353744.1 solute carrier family 41 member 1-like isoform X2 [Paramacrobiotus metropolitanus]
MVPAFFRTTKAARGDRYFGAGQVEVDLDEMLPLTNGDAENGVDEHDVRDTKRIRSHTDSYLVKPKSHADRKGSNFELNKQHGIEMDVFTADGTHNDQPEGHGGRKSFMDAMAHDLLLPAAAIASDIAHYPIVEEVGEGPTIDDLVREDIPLHSERLRAVVLQVMGPFFVAGLGMVAAGMVLDIVQHWDVFLAVSELFVMVPALLGLKGNLEMTLAARLSTALNIGNLTPAKRWKVIGANLALTQAQAVIVGSLASVFAVFVGFIGRRTVDWGHALLILGAASVTTAIASSVLGAVMVGVILLSEKYHINPDNVATPIAASLGDVTTLGILSGFAYLFYSVYQTTYWFLGPAIVIVIVWALLPLWIVLARTVEQTRIVLRSGWIPVISAMLISSFSGAILAKVLSGRQKYFMGIAVYQPVMNGVAGNLVAVQASRISTHLHCAYGEPGQIPGDFKVCPNPCFSFCSRNYMNARTARVLLLMLIPGHLLFLCLISWLQAGHTSLTPKFITVFILAALIQVSALLYIAEALTHLVWKRGIDPDSFTIPYLTALGDLSGTALLTGAFWLLYVTGDKDLDVSD